MLTKEANNYINQHNKSIDIKYKPKFHLSSPIGWINDPNGFSFYNGTFHMFFQFHPYSTEWGPMHWGHSTSNDLLTWNYHNVALAPQKLEVDAHACYSGSALVEDNKHILMYTEVIGNIQAQNIAISTDGVSYEKIQENYLFDASVLPKNLNVPLNELRDPFIFKRNDIYYAIIVCMDQIEKVGMVALFDSKDMIHWEYKGILLKGTKEQGTMWECPSYAHIDGKDVIFVSILDTPETKDFKSQNLVSAYYYLGHLNLDQATFQIEHYDELDAGFEYYANQVHTYKEKAYLSAWLHVHTRRTAQQQLNQGWTGIFSLPRELSIKDNKLIQKPVSSIYKLLDTTTCYSSENSSHIIPSDSSNIILEFTQAVTELDIKLHNEKEDINLILKDNIISLNRANSGLLPLYEHQLDNPTNIRKLIYKEKISHIEIIYDVSVIEIFINEGDKTMTSLVTPENPYKTISINSENEYILKIKHNKSL